MRRLCISGVRQRPLSGVVELQELHRPLGSTERMAADAEAVASGFREAATKARRESELLRTEAEMFRMQAQACLQISRVRPGSAVSEHSVQQRQLYSLYQPHGRGHGHVVVG